MFKSFKGLVAGLVAGTLVGVLFAPKKGQELRKEFKKELDKGGLGLDTLKDTVSVMGKDIGETGKQISKTDAYKKAQKEVSKRAKDLVEENIPSSTRKQAKKTFVKAKEILKKAISRTKKNIKK